MLRTQQRRHGFYNMNQLQCFGLIEGADSFLSTYIIVIYKFNKLYIYGLYCGSMNAFNAPLYMLPIFFIYSGNREKAGYLK
jgi:hypothetical protein